MLVLIHTLLGLVAGGAAGWFLRDVTGWADAHLVGAACGCIGQASRATLAWISRPSEQTAAYQSRVNSPAVIASLTLALVTALTLLRFPATFIVPAASYLLIRVLLSWQNKASLGSLSPVALQLAARGAELITVTASALAAREPLS